MTYGTATASFLAIRCLYELANIFESLFPVASQVVRRDFYVDDLITGANSIEEAQQLQSQINSLLLNGCFELRKWVSNEPEILNNISDKEIENKIIKFSSNDMQVKTLGMEWHPTSDYFSYSRFEINETTRVTKRKILSEISKIFDPLGLIAPILIKGKLIMQELWQLQVNWDDILLAENCKAWQNLQVDLKDLSNLIIKRNVMSDERPVNIELHGFSDASSYAYGALYLY